LVGAQGSQGAQGAQGPQGYQGYQGPQGPQGVIDPASTTTFTTNQIIEGTTTSALLRITQLGTGNALLVEDSTNPDSTPFVVDAAGLVGIGISAPTVPLDVATTGNASNFTRFSADVSGTNILLRKSRGSSIGTNTVVNNADNLGSIFFQGADGSTYVSAAQIVAQVDAAPASGDVAGRLAFLTRPTAGSLTQRMRIDSAGNITIGDTTANAPLGTTLRISKNITGSVTSNSVTADGAIQSDVTLNARGFISRPTVAAASFTLSNLVHFYANPNTVGTGATITNSIGFHAESTLGDNSSGTVTNAYGFYGNLASGTNRYNLFMEGSASNYLAGSLGIGTTAQAGSRLHIGGANITGAVTSIGVRLNATVQSDVTTEADGFRSAITTAAASFTLPALYHFFATGATPGAGSTITTQAGFVVGSAMTGATNNYAFYSTLAAATGSFSLYMAGTAANYLAGRLGVGASVTSGSMVGITNTTAADKVLVVKGAASQTGTYFEAQNSAGTMQAALDANGIFRFNSLTDVSPLVGVTPDLQVNGLGNDASIGIGRFSADTVPARLLLTKSRNTTIGSHTAVASGDTVGVVHFVSSDGTSYLQTANIGVIAEGTVTTGAVPGRIVFNYANSAGNLTEAMRIDSAGQVGIGGTPAAGRNFVVTKNITGSVSSFGIRVDGAIQSDVTTLAVAYRSSVSTAAASFTLTDLLHFEAPGIATPGSGSTISNQYGYKSGSNMTGATNNYGFYSDLAAASGRWNFYANGTAANYLAGRLGVGAILTSGAMAQVTNTTAADKVLVVKGAASQTGTLLDLQNSAGTVLSTFNESGQFIFGNSAGISPISGVAASIQAHATTASGIASYRWSADAGSSWISLVKSRGGVGTYTTVNSGDTTGVILSTGADGTSFVESARIIFAVDGTPSTGVMPGRIVFATSSASATNVERMRIDSVGNLLVGMTTIATSSAKTVHIANGTAPTANPSGGGVLYVESGALKYRGSSGTVTTIANA
jgi:hypothetical protein